MLSQFSQPSPYNLNTIRPHPDRSSTTPTLTLQSIDFEDETPKLGETNEGFWRLCPTLYASTCSLAPCTASRHA
jgi:hypothetical protein